MGMECDVARGPKKVMDEGEDAELTSLKKPGRGAAWRSGVKGAPAEFMHRSSWH